MRVSDSIHSQFDRGFTLIELLVVIAILGILASLVIASLGSSRERARDGVRISDLQQLSIALALYRDANGQYPAALSAIAPTYTPVVPSDPRGGAYTYATNSGTPTTSYVIAATLEQAGNKPSNAVSGTIHGVNCSAATTYCVTR